jgi:O-succinylbenzoic acid--CoA ligase
LQPGDAWLACLPLFHIGGFSILTRCAFAGARMILHQGFDADRVADGLSAARVTHLSLTPSMLAQLLALDRRPPSCLRHVLVGGAALSAELAGAANEEGWPIQPTYGMSECSSQLATLPRLSSNWRTGQVGRPLRGAEIGLTPDGRLKTHGPMVMQGYANPGLTPGDGLDEGWFVSNDLAEISPEGALTVLGRADDMIVSGGKKVHPLAIARELAACPGIGDFAIVGRPDPIWGEVVTVAYTGATPCEALLQWSRAHLSSAFRPRAAVRVAALPLLANGKPDRSALREMAERRDAKARALGETQKALG